MHPHQQGLTARFQQDVDMSDKRKPFDAKAVNPRYEGLSLSDAVRVLTRPKNPAARATLDRLQGRQRGER